jgi:hypothetical protein
MVLDQYASPAAEFIKVPSVVVMRLMGVGGVVVASYRSGVDGPFGSVKTMRLLSELNICCLL